MNYSNLPVYIKQEDATIDSASIAYNYIPAQNASVEYQAQNDAFRTLGANINPQKQFTNGAALQAKINFNSYINSETSGALADILNSSGENSYSIRVGNNTYDECYLSNYEVSVEPFKPVSLSASYVVAQAPKINLNQESFIAVTTPGSRNELLYSESLTGENYIYTNLEATTGQPDPTGGNKATLISGQSSSETSISYASNNNSPLDTAAFLSDSSSILLTSLQTQQSKSQGVDFTGGKQFPMDNSFYSKVWISNNGIISFDDSDTGFDGDQPDDLPIDSSTRKFIAAYWVKMDAQDSIIRYKQFDDRFVVQYTYIRTAIGGLQQTFQIRLFFDTGNIEISYFAVTSSGTLKPNASIGIQWGKNKYIDYPLSLIDATKDLKFNRVSTVTSVNPNFVYKTQITPNALRTFSINLKRSVGNGNIRYTLDGGTNWSAISPALNSVYTRYSFPSTTASQQIGIEVESAGDAILIHGGQLEPLGYATDYIPTSGAVGVRESVTVNMPVDTVYPAVDLTTGFANTMINGDNCSVSSTAAFVSNIQSSIRYSVNCARTPVYTIGSTNASRHILDTVEKQMDISSTNLASFIDFSGSKLSSDLNLTLQNSQGDFSSIIAMKSGANIFSQQTNTQEGDTVVTQVSIKEIIV